MRISTLVWGLVGVIAFSGVARSQSLADVARKEEERRKTVKTSGKTYTNADLRRVPVTAPPEAPAAAEPAAGGSQAPGAGGDEASAKGEQPQEKAADATPSIDQGEEHWRTLITEARGALSRSTTYLEALRSRVATLTTEFYAREDPVQRSAIWTQRTRVMDDMQRLEQDMAAQEKAVAKIEEDARKAGIPPGWIR